MFWRSTLLGEAHKSSEKALRVNSWLKGTSFSGKFGTLICWFLWGLTVDPPEKLWGFSELLFAKFPLRVNSWLAVEVQSMLGTQVIAEKQQCGIQQSDTSGAAPSKLVSAKPDQRFRHPKLGSQLANRSKIRNQKSKIQIPPPVVPHLLQSSCQQILIKGSQV